jgi:hypothetical protein
MIIAVPNAEGVCGSVRNSLLNYPPHHLTWWSGRALNKLVTQAGLENVAVHAEPLQRVHFGMGFFAWLYPRRDSHFDFSLKAWFVQNICALLGRMVPRRISEVPFVRGHTLMMVARKPG